MKKILMIFRKLLKRLKRKLRGRDIIYLAGPMEYITDAGINWRIDYTHIIESLGHKTIIPELEESFIIDQEELMQLKHKNIKEYKSIIRQLIKLDLHFVKTVDYIIVKWNAERTAGTIGEAQEAYLCGTPVYLITDLEEHQIPGWFLACLTKVFTNLKDTLDFHYSK